MAVGVCLLFVNLTLAGPPELSRDDVIHIANAFAEREGVCLTCYKWPVITYHRAQSGSYWVAYYSPKPPHNGIIAADADFAVRIDETSHLASHEPLR